MIITKDPSIKYYDSDKTESADKTSSSSSADICIPSSVKSKFLIPWGMDNITSCYGCRTDAHRGMDFQYTAKSISEGYDFQVYPIYPGEVIKTGNAGD